MRLVAKYLAPVATAFFVSSVSVSALTAAQKAQECGKNGDPVCAFDLLIEHFEDTGQPFTDEQGYQLLSGAMLEASLIDAAYIWGPSTSLEKSKRYLSVLQKQNNNRAFGYASGYGVAAMACEKLEDETCFNDYIDDLCENAEILGLPMDGDPRFLNFKNELVEILIRECGNLE